MKNIQLGSLAILLVIMACGGEPTKKEKEQKLTALRAEYKTLGDEIKDLEEEIAKLMTPEDSAAIAQQVTLVSTFKLKPSDFIHKMEVRGEVESRKNIMLSAQSNGEIKSIKVKEGQFVQQGTVLMVQDSEILRSTVKELNTSLDLATTLYEKQKRLYKEQGIGTEVQYLQAKNNKESLESKLATVRAQLAQTIVKAPFSGIVDEIPIRQGEVAMPGTPIVRLFSAGNLYIKADVSERYIGKFKKGDDVEVKFPYFDKAVESKIMAIGQVVNSQNRTFTIEVALPKIEIEPKPNMVAVVKMKDYEQSAVHVVPTNVIQKDQKGYYVFTIAKDGEKTRAKKMHVTTGLSYEGKTEIKEGLNGGEMIVDKGARLIAQGELVRLNAK